MSLAIRPYVTAAVAMACAGIVVATPVAPPAAGMQAVQLTAAEGFGDVIGDVTGLSGLLDELVIEPALDTLGPGGLSAASSLSLLDGPGLASLADPIDPITAYLQFFQETFANISTLAGEVFADPAPILQQLITNLIDYAITLAKAGITVPFNLVGYAISTLPLIVVTLISSDNIQEALQTLFTDLVILPLVVIPAPVTSALGEVSVTLVEHLQAAVQTIVSQSSTVVAGLLTPFVTLAGAVGSVADDLVAAVQSANPLAFVDTVVTAPATLAGAFLNGVPGSPGILTSPDGTIQVLLDFRAAIAAAIGSAGTNPLSELESLTSGAAGFDALSNLGTASDIGGLPGLADLGSVVQDLAQAFGGTFLDAVPF